MQADHASAPSQATRAQLEAAAENYQQGLAQIGALDFDDLLLKALELAEQSQMEPEAFSYLLWTSFRTSTRFSTV